MVSDVFYTLSNGDQKGLMKRLDNNFCEKGKLVLLLN
jgi:hypothetical protein